jgi:hypothetical protein
MPKIILEIMISYYEGWVIFKKEGEFIPIPGMIIKFPKHMNIEEFVANTNPDFFPEWDVEKNEIRAHISDINTEDLDIFRKRVQAFKKEGWKIADISQVEEELKGII